MQPNQTTVWGRKEKSALWNNAYVAKYPQRDIVVVPLDFVNGSSVTSPLTGDEKLSLEKQSKLVLYKNDAGEFKAEVYTYLPSRDYLLNPSNKFSGIVIVDDWAGNNISNFIFRQGKFKTLKKSNSQNQGIGGRTESDGISCYVLNYYLCDVDANNNYTNCELIGSVPLGCFNSNNDEVEWVDPPGGGGGSSVTYYPEEEITVTKIKDWELHNENTGGSPGFLKVMGKVALYGKKNASYPQGGYFTGTSENTSYTVNFPYDMSFQQLGNQSWHGNQNAYHHVQGNVIYPPNTIPYLYVQKTQTFTFVEVFP